MYSHFVLQTHDKFQSQLRRVAVGGRNQVAHGSRQPRLLGCGVLVCGTQTRHWGFAQHCRSLRNSSPVLSSAFLHLLFHVLFSLKTLHTSCCEKRTMLSLPSIILPYYTAGLQQRHTPTLPLIGLHKTQSRAKSRRAGQSPCTHCTRTGTEYELHRDSGNPVRLWVPLNVYFREKMIFSNYFVCMGILLACMSDVPLVCLEVTKSEGCQIPSPGLTSGCEGHVHTGN